MNYLIILAAALLPAIVLWVYVQRQDPQPEPRNWLIRATLYGVGIIFPVALLEMYINTALFGPDGGPATLLGTTVEAFFVAALPEESFKLLALWLVLRKNPYFDEHYDGIVYAVCIGLGFAAIENVSYLFENTDAWLSVAISRALLAVPGHYAFAVMMGYYYSLYHFVDPSPRTAACILLVPVVAHGIYDALALSGMVSPMVGSLSFFVLVYFCSKMHKFARSKMLAQIKRDLDRHSA
ncbi:MAG: PrsW family intramembrane metalloprotease [Prevotella sp.]|nr:PrsW family intramembrane metalloprotease [Prevotella sp.]